MRWINKSTYVDLETGEEIPKEKVGGYHTVRREKKVTINEKQTLGKITWIYLCRKNPEQKKLWTQI